MKILVGYDGGEVGRMALSLARDMAGIHSAMVYVMTSMTGGASEKKADIEKAEADLEFARLFMENSGIQCETLQSVRGFSPGEDIVKFAGENDIDHIFVGIRKKSRTQKAILGSTARYVILKAPCPVTSVKFEVDSISSEDLLRDRHILVVDDEPDILETVEELLDICTLDLTDSFDAAKKLLKKNRYDLAILDIMGVSGYDILELARKNDVPALMLTAHALTPENLKESIQKGADSYIPKDELANLTAHAADVIRARLQGRQGSWFSNLKPFFDKTFGKGWQDKDRNFWSSFDDTYGK